MIRFFIFHSTCSSQNVRKQELHYLNAILLIISANNVNQEPQSARKSCFLHPVLQNHRWHCSTKTTWLVAAGDGKIARVGLQKCLQVSSQIPTGVTQTAAGSLPPPPPPSADVIWHVWYKCQPRTYLAQTFPATSCRATAVTQPCTFILTLLPLNSPINQCAYLINFSNNNKKKQQRCNNNR